MAVALNLISLDAWWNGQFLDPAGPPTFPAWDSLSQPEPEFAGGV